MKSQVSTAHNRVSDWTYPMRLFWDEEDEAWVAEVTDLPGCVGVGDTPTEAAQVARGFIDSWIDDAVAAGEEIPKPTVRARASGRFLTRVPRSLHGRLQRLADDEGTSLNQLVVAILSEGIANRQIEVAVEHITASVEEIAKVSEDVRIGWSGWFRKVLLPQLSDMHSLMGLHPTIETATSTFYLHKSVESSSAWEYENVHIKKAKPSGNEVTC